MLLPLEVDGVVGARLPQVVGAPAQGDGEGVGVLHPCPGGGVHVQTSKICFRENALSFYAKEASGNV
jgi:hypothetical protein